MKIFGSGVLSFILGVLVLLNSGCKKTEEEPAPIETGVVTDIENNVYKTVKIGNQWWMAENLKVKTYRNGVPIVSAQDDNEWIDTTGAYCLYDNNANSPGLLYNWRAVNNPNMIAPQGWHIPSDQEWKELERYIGMSENDAGKKGWRGTHEGEMLKVEGTQAWSAFGDVWPTNESGFTALAGGCRLFNGVWGTPGLFSTGFWWTSTKSNETNSWYRYLDYKNAQVFRSYTDMKYGFSIRCVKD